MGSSWVRATQAVHAVCVLAYPLPLMLAIPLLVGCPSMLTAGGRRAARTRSACVRRRPAGVGMGIHPVLFKGMMPMPTGGAWHVVHIRNCQMRAVVDGWHG